MLEDKDNYIASFMEKNSGLISRMSGATYDNSGVALSAFKMIVKSALDNAYIRYSGKEKESDYLDSYLRGTLKITNLKLANENKTTTLVCPGCKEKGHIEVLIFTSNGLCCANCLKEVASSAKENLLHSTFSTHASVGHRCSNCARFIPQQSVNDICCPYSDCNFTGKQDSLAKMRHPSVSINRAGATSNFDRIPSSSSASVSRISAQEEVGKINEIINQCISDQIKTLHFKGFAATYTNKLCMYRAFKSALDKFPEEMIPYLSNVGRVANGGAKLQSKILQEFVKHLEVCLPYRYIQNGKEFEVKSLLDEKLSFFNGESVFDAEIDEQFEIPNLTEEIYVGSRSAYYCLPYYIGKLIDISEIGTGKSIINDVFEYSCTKIHMKSQNISPGTKVQVRHLRIVPHYSMGVFVYLNRQKKILAERVQAKLAGLK